MKVTLQLPDTVGKELLRLPDLEAFVSLAVMKALEAGTEGSGALKAGVLEAAEVVLSRLDVGLRARRAQSP